MESAAVDTGWMPGGSGLLGAVASVDPRPDTVEDVLNVCPRQAACFRGRHLRLAWVDSPADPTQGWPGRRGPARVRVDTALRPQDPAVLIMPGPTAPARDPVVGLRACPIPPHYVQPWATIEVVRDSGAGELDEEEEEGEDAGKERPNPSAEGMASMSALRPEPALELLRGCAVRTDGVVHLLAAATDPACRGVRLLCRRAPEFVVPPLPAPAAPETSATSNHHRGDGDGVTAARGGHPSGKKTGCARPRGTGRRRTEGEAGRGAGEHRQRPGVEAGDGVEAGGRGPAGEGGVKENQRGAWAETAEQETATTAAGRRRSGRGRGTPVGGKGRAGGEEEEGDWARRLSGWGVVTTGSEVVVPHKALEVWYHDTRRRPASSASSASPRGEPAWVEAVLRSHEPSVVDDLSAGLGLDVRVAAGGGRCPSADRGGETEERREEDDREGRVAGVTSAGDGALLVHGPPGVGKTRLVEALAVRFGCRLVKVSPGRLAAAAGVQADRVLMEAFRYCRQCVSSRVLLLLDSVDRLTPAAEGNVGASRGEVDAGLLNAFVLAIEQGRRDPRWRGRVAVVGVTSWLDHVHPTARRCAGQEVLVPPPSQPLRAKILRHALRPAGEEQSIEAGDAVVEEAVAEVVGLCQGFTAGDMCAVAAATLELWAAAFAASQARGGGGGDGGGRRRAGARQVLSRGEALRAGFRQVRQRVAAGRGGAGDGGGSASVSGVPCVRWSEVGGLERAKRAVQEMVVWPARYPEAFSRMGITPASGVLLFGPPGTGKTLLAKAAATETGATFIELKISDVVRGEIGESEKAVDRAFRTARELAPSIVFIDEFQALFAARDAGGGTGSRLASQLLVCMDELARWRAAGLRVTTAAAATAAAADTAGGRTRSMDESAQDGRASPSAGQQGAGISSSANVMVLAATNAPEAVDAAFLRPGRFDEIVYAGLPDAEGREHILRATKDRMEGLRATRAATPASAAQLSGSAADETSRTPRGDGKVLPTTLPEERATTVAAAPAAAAAAPNDASASAAAAATAAAAPAEKVTKTKLPHADTSSTDGGGGGGGDGSDRTGRGGGGGRWARDVDVAWLSRETKGYSGADLSSLVRNAAMVALREEGERATERAVRPAGSAGGGSVGGRGLLVLARRHFEAALASTEPSSGPDAVAKHERWARQWHVAS